MAAQFFFSLSWLFWAAMYSFITYFVNLIQFWGTNKVAVVVVVVVGMALRRLEQVRPVSNVVLLPS